MSEAMFTQLTISVQGKKQSGKTRFTDDLLAPLVEAMGGKVIKKNDDKTGVYITVSLPQGSFPAAPKGGEKTLFGKLIGMVRGEQSDPAAITFTPAAPGPMVVDGPQNILPLEEWLGEDVEIRDGEIRAKIVAAPSAPPPAGSIVINGAVLEKINILAVARTAALRAVRDDAYRRTIVKAPQFVFGGELDRVVRASAVAELRRIDAFLMELGLRWEDET